MPRNFDSNENEKCLPWKSGNMDVENVKNFFKWKKFIKFFNKKKFFEVNGNNKPSLVVIDLLWHTDAT